MKGVFIYMEFLEKLNVIIASLFFLCYSYQFFYIPVVLFRKREEKAETYEERNRYAILICARNEEKVIGDLLSSIANQTYPGDLLKVFVIADNCTDKTKEISESLGAKVYERNDRNLIGKGYALQALLNNIKRDFGDIFDGYFVFDADNILERDYISCMNRTFTSGYDIVTSYRNSKNYGDNWISSGYALWFLRESRYLNHARMLLGFSSAVSGTGFMFGKNILNEMGDWKYHLLTEDIEFSVDQITKGKKIGFSPDAVLYDEQPVKFSQSVTQRMRWAKGYIEVFRDYGKGLLKGIFKGSFSCFDMAMNIMPAFILSAFSIAVNVSIGIVEGVTMGSFSVFLKSLTATLFGAYMTLFLLGSITLLTEWKRIHGRTFRKMKSAFTFPLFMLTYLPISLCALFKDVTWKPIEHTRSMKEISLK